MDISAYLASVQDNPQSAMLARNVMQPGIPSPSGENAPDAGIPQPSWSDQSQQDTGQDTGQVTGGFDQAQMGMDAPTPAPMQDMGAPPQQQQTYAPPQQQQQASAPPQMDMGALDAGGSSAEDFTGSSYGDSNEGYARGGMVAKAPRRPRLPKSGKPQAGGQPNGGLFSPSTRSARSPDPATFQPEGSISDIGMYDASGNLKGITDIGVTKNEIYGNPNFRHNDVANGEARGDNEYGVGGPAGDSSGGLAEGGSVDELPSSENIDDRRGKDSLDMNAAQAADVTGAPLGYGMLKGTPYRQAKADHEVAPKRPLLWDDPANDLASTSRPIPKFEDAGPVDEAIAPAIPDMPPEGDAPGIPPKESVDAEGLPNTAIAPAVDAGFKEIYNKAGVNAGVPTPQVQHNAKQMFDGAGATPPYQAEAAIEANEGNSGKTVKAVYDFFNAGKDASKDLTALHDYASDKINPNPTPGHGRSDFEEMGAQAAAGMLQHIRTVWNKSSSLASAAADQGNMPKAAEAFQVALDKGVPDGSRVQVTPNQGGVDVSVDGKSTPLTPQQMHHIAATPFDVIAHIGVPHTLANLQNVQQLQHPSGQPQQPQAPAPQQPPAAASPANWPGKSQGYHQEQSEAGRAQVRASRDQGQPGVPVSADEPLPETIKMVRGSYMTGGGRGSPVTMHGQSSEKVNARTGDVIPNETPQERVANIAAKARTGQEQIRQQGLNTRASEGAMSPHGREAQLKMQRERQALTAAQAEIKAAENAGKPIDAGAVYKKFGLEHLLAGAGGGAAQTQGPKVGQVVNGKTFLGGNPNDRNSWR